jgi:hypothetical protein
MSGKKTPKPKFSDIVNNPEPRVQMNMKLPVSLRDQLAVDAAAGTFRDGKNQPIKTVTGIFLLGLIQLGYPIDPLLLKDQRKV